MDKGSDEIWLGSVFNEMLDSLEKSSKRERQFSDASWTWTPISVIMAESEYGKNIQTLEEAKESLRLLIGKVREWQLW